MQNNLAKNTEKLIFILIITFLAIIRFWNINQKGIYYHDEAAFIGNARFYGDLGRYFIVKVFSGTFNFSDSVHKAYEIWQDGGNPWQNARPLMYFLYITAAFLTGYQEVPCMLISGTAGLLTLLFIKETKCFKGNNFPAIWAVLLLGLSVWHIQYSRSALSQSISLLLVGIVIKKVIDYNNSKEKSAKDMFLISLYTGLAFTTHYNLFWLPVFIGLWLCLTSWKKFGKNNFLNLMLKSAGFMIFPLLFFEVPSYIIMKIAGPRINDPLYSKAFSSYFQQIYFQMTWFKGKEGLLQQSKMFFFNWIIGYEGLLFVLLITIGIFYLIFQSFNKDKNAVFLLFMFFVPLITWSAFGFPVPRSFIPVLLPGCLSFAMFIDSLSDKIMANKYKYINIFVSFIILLNLMINMDKIQAMITAESPYKIISEKIIDFKEKKPEIYLSNNEISTNDKPILRCYLKNMIKKDKNQGNIFISSITSRHDLKERADFIEKNYHPLISIESKLDYGMVLEDGLVYDLIEEYRANKDNQIRVYYLGKK